MLHWAPSKAGSLSYQPTPFYVNDDSSTHTPSTALDLQYIKAHARLALVVFTNTRGQSEGMSLLWDKFTIRTNTCLDRNAYGK